MAKPTEVASWSTDPGTTLEPSAGEKAAGFQLGEKPRARWLNWLLNISGQWQAYVRDLNTEPEFLNKPFAWLGAHSWGDAVLTPGRLDAQTVATDALVRRTPAPVDLVIPLESFRDFENVGNGRWLHAFDGTQIFTMSADAYARCGFRIPPGHRLLSARAYTFQPSNSTITISLHKLRRGADAPYENVRTSLSSATITVVGSAETVLAGDDYTSNAALDTYQVELVGNLAGCMLRALTVRIMPYGDLGALL